MMSYDVIQCTFINEFAKYLQLQLQNWVSVNIQTVAGGSSCVTLSTMASASAD